MAQGDQIYVYRELLNLEGVYEHHGIDCGDGTVIHYRKPSETIERTSWEVFKLGNPIYRKKHNQQFCFLPDIVIRRAESRLGEQKYHLLFNNCEHFASWCKTGISESQQIREFLPFVTQLNPEKFPQFLQEVFKDSDPDKAQRLLKDALGDLKEVWDDIQPRYQSARLEAASWQRVAQEAIKGDREDLARAAIAKKQDYQQQAETFETQLKELGLLTEKIVKQSLLR